MKCKLLNEEERKRIVLKVKPDKTKFSSFQYLNLLTGVTDEKNELIMTRTFFSCVPAAKNEEAYSEAGFIVLGTEKSFSIHIREYTHGERYRNIKSPCPEMISDEKLLEMISYYNKSYIERTRIERKSDEYQKAYYSFYRNYTDMYLNKEYFKNEEPDDGKNPITRTRTRVRKISEVRKAPPAPAPEKNEDISIILITAVIAIVLICIVRIVNSII